MTNIHHSSPSAVPSIHVLAADDPSTLFSDEETFLAGVLNFCTLAPVEGTSQYGCPQGFQAPCLPQADLDDMPEFSHLTTTGNQEYLTGPASYSLPYPAIVHEPGTLIDGRLSPYAVGGSPIPSPSSSLTSSLSPSSTYEPLAFHDLESHTPSPATPDQDLVWPHELDPSFIGSLANDSGCFVPPQSGPKRQRATSSPPRRGPVASKAMLEANSRRRRHPAQFVCSECSQTFTALFSLRRHAQSHTGERPFKCSIPGCGQRFFNSSDCKRHEKSKKRHK